jgi:uncharacterized membrane protein
MVNLGLFAGLSSARATGISADGMNISLRGENASFGPIAALGWSSPRGFFALSSPVNSGPEAQAVSGNGAVFVGNLTAGAARGYRWTSAGIEPLGVLPNRTTSNAYAVNFDGSVIVGVCGFSTEARGFRWVAGTGMTDIGAVAGGTATIPLGVSNDGKVITGFCYAPGGYPGFQWTQATGMRELGRGFGGSFAQGQCVSGDGYLIGGYAGNRAMFWTPDTGPIDLADHLISLGVDLSEWSNLLSVRAVNFNGTVLVGRGLSATGVDGAFLVHIPPIPHARCSADFNEDGLMTLQDIFEFLRAYFDADPRADFDQSGATSVEDVFAFLGAFFRGCS